jgi:hypothetical protein
MIALQGAPQAARHPQGEPQGRPPGEPQGGLLGKASQRAGLLASFRLLSSLATGRSPLTAALARSCADALTSVGTGPLRDLLLDDLAGRLAARPPSHPIEPALVLAAALHHHVLGLPRGAPLAALYPSAGGAFRGAPEEESALRGALEETVRARPADLCGFVREGALSPCEPGRAGVWLQPARALQAERALPLDLIDIRAHAGLALVGDQLDPQGANLRVEGRVGFQSAPLDIEKEPVRRALRACVWADDLARLRRLEAAMEHLLRLRGEGRGPVLLRGDPASLLPEAVERLLSVAGPGPRRLIIYCASAAAGGMGQDPDVDLDEEAARLQMRVRSALSRWAAALWIEVGGTPFAPLVARRLRGGALETLRLAGPPAHLQALLRE